MTHLTSMQLKHIECKSQLFEQRCNISLLRRVVLTRNCRKLGMFLATYECVECKSFFKFLWLCLPALFSKVHTLNQTKKLIECQVELAQVQYLSKNTCMTVWERRMTCPGHKKVYFVNFASAKSTLSAQYLRYFRLNSYVEQ